MMLDKHKSPGSRSPPTISIITGWDAALGQYLWPVISAWTFSRDEPERAGRFVLDLNLFETDITIPQLDWQNLPRLSPPQKSQRNLRPND